MHRSGASSLRRLALLTTVLTCSGCGYLAARDLDGEAAPAPSDFSFVGDKSPCYLELQKGVRALRVNCFHLDGVLHIHSSRWAKLPRLWGENWTVTVRRAADVRIQIAEKIYSMTAAPIDNEDRRQQILDDRGYWHAWDGIMVFQFTPTD